jgi:hypothetical protein
LAGAGDHVEFPLRLRQMGARVPVMMN